MYLIDASIFLEVELEQEKHEACEIFLKRLEKGDAKAVVSDFTLDSIAIVMEANGKSWSDIREFFISISMLDGLSVYKVTHTDRIKATDHMEKFRLDFDDSVVLQSAFSNSIKEIVSLDKDFNSLKGIRRLEPKDAV